MKCRIWHALARGTTEVASWPVALFCLLSTDSSVPQHSAVPDSDVTAPQCPTLRARGARRWLSRNSHSGIDLPLQRRLLTARARWNITQALRSSLARSHVTNASKCPAFSPCGILQYIALLDRRNAPQSWRVAEL